MCQQAAGTSSKLLFVLENYGLVERPLRACCKTDSKTTNGVNWWWLLRTLRLGQKEKKRLNGPKLSTTLENMYTSKHSRLLIPVTQVSNLTNWMNEWFLFYMEKQPVVSCFHFQLKISRNSCLAADVLEKFSSAPPTKTTRTTRLKKTTRTTVHRKSGSRHLIHLGIRYPVPLSRKRSK